MGRTQAGPGRTVKQEQEEISPNHVQRLNLISVDIGRKEMLVEQIRLFILDVQSPCMVPRTGEWCGVSRFVPDGKWDWNYTHHRVAQGQTAITLNLRLGFVRNLDLMPRVGFG